MGKQRGFTLMEALTTLVVAAIVIGVGVPGMLSLMAKRRIEGAAAELQAQLQLMRSQAIKQNHNAYVSFSSSGSTWQYGLDDTAPCNPATAGDCSVHGVPKVFNNGAWKGVELSQNFTNNTVGFEPRRGMALNTGTITLTSPGGTVKLNINSMGHVAACSVGGAVSNFPSCAASP